MTAYEVPFKVRLQEFLGRIVYAPLLWWVIASMMLAGYRIRNHREFRKFYRDLTAPGQPPLLICPNHLTYVDSIMIIFAFGPHFWYALHFRKHPWNLAAREYAKNPVFRFVLYFSKCIFIEREKEREKSYPTLRAAEALLRRGDIVMVFPEGRRSKTGRFDDNRLAFGVGKMVSSLPECRVLCTYMRADKQGDRAGSFPPANSEFRILTDLVTYRTAEMGPNPVEAITHDIARRIQALEAQYFATVSAPQTTEALSPT